MLVVLALCFVGLGFYYENQDPSIANESKVPTNDNIVLPIKSESDDEITIVTEAVVAYIESIEGNKITLDYFDLLEGGEAEKAAVADGKCTQREIDEQSGCFSNGTLYFRNKNPKLRTFTMAQDVEVITASAFAEDPDGIINISIQDLKKDYVDIYTPEGERLYIPYKVRFNSEGEVSVIEEIFRP